MTLATDNYEKPRQSFDSAEFFTMKVSFHGSGYVFPLNPENKNE
jgi:hypothetical protein